MLLRLSALGLLTLLATGTSTFAADEENPFKKAKVGDFAKYAVIFKSGTVETKSLRVQTVTAASEKEVSLKTVLIVDGKEIAGKRSEQKIDLTKPFDAVAGETSLVAGLKWEKHKDGREKVKIGDKEYDCNWTSYKAVVPAGAPVPVDGEVKVWMSKDVPFVVKRTLAVKTGTTELVYTTELTEFGSKK